MSDLKDKARELLAAFKGGDYAFGLGCYGRLGELAGRFGRRAAVVTSGMGKEWGPGVHAATDAALSAAGIERVGEAMRGARPNAPQEDVLRLAAELAERDADVIVAVGGGSGIDAAKAAAAAAALGEADLDAMFGVGQVSALLAQAGREMPPIVAAQLASGSAAHLTKYSNVTDLATAQKMLIVDEAVVPPAAVFDYTWTRTMTPAFTMDGALDGVSHCLEVWMGVGDAAAADTREVCLTGIELIVGELHAAVADGENLDAREALGLGTDLGGYAIMIGGTNGAHLNSFSLVDLLPHGRACAVMNPYYAVLFAPAIPERLRAVGEVYRRAGYVTAELDALRPRELGIAVAEGMVAMSRAIGFPATLAEIDGFSDEHVDRCLRAAKDPKLASKLANMPVALTPDNVDEIMGSVLDAAGTGDFRKIAEVDVP